MHQVFHKLSQLFLLLWHWKFFQFAQVLTSRLFPSRVLRIRKLILFQLSQKKYPPKQTDENIKIQRGDKQAVRNMVRDLYDNDPQTLDFYENFFDQGFEPWIAQCDNTQHDNTVVGVVWLFSAPYLSIWEGYDAYLLRFHANPGAKFLGNGFVSPQLRGQGLFALIVNSCFAAYPNVEFYSTVDETNTSSIRFHEKIGFRICGTVRYVRFFQSTFCGVALKRWRICFYRLRKGKETDIFLNS